MDFWFRLGESGAFLAVGCLLVCLLLAILSLFRGVEPRKKIGWCATLNLATIVLMIVGLPVEQG